MKKLSLYIFSILLFFVNSHAFDVDLKVTLTCSLSAKNNKDFATKTWSLDSKEKSGFLTFANKKIIQWHENITVKDNPLTWLVIFYSVDRYSGKGYFDATEDMNNDFFKNFLRKNIERKDAVNLLKSKIETSGKIECESSKIKKF
tara:strand:- start:68 stop:502 length:435 start_codon:yes stop_codon:yes gene_type:complete